IEEIQIAQGSGEFADAAIAAIRQARYHPAANKGAGIRYPIALEFQFSLHSAERTASAGRGQ
ncbi:MAG TPA: energy transducer TonB, partial [Casimicrobiaceae bacterium]|nr:energy transducer TonB [Casimicrobiaceae bacterium]